MDNDFELPGEENPPEEVRETFLYAALRSLMVGRLIELGYSLDEAEIIIAGQDRIWELLGGEVIDDWDVNIYKE